MALGHAGLALGYLIRLIHNGQFPTLEGCADKITTQIHDPWLQGLSGGPVPRFSVIRDANALDPCASPALYSSLCVKIPSGLVVLSKSQALFILLAKT